MDQILKNKRYGIENKAEIEVHPIVAGNFTRNRVIRYMKHWTPSLVSNVDDIHFNGFLRRSIRKTTLPVKMIGRIQTNLVLLVDFI